MAFCGLMAEKTKVCASKHVLFWSSKCHRIFDGLLTCEETSGSGRGHLLLRNWNGPQDALSKIFLTVLSDGTLPTREDDEIGCQRSRNPSLLKCVSASPRADFLSVPVWFALHPLCPRSVF